MAADALDVAILNAIRAHAIESGALVHDGRVDIDFAEVVESLCAIATSVAFDLESDPLKASLFLAECMGRWMAVCAGSAERGGGTLQ